MDGISLPAKEHELVLVTGPSGAGRTTAIRAFEDLGYEAIDNLPLSLVSHLVDGPPLGRPIALGLDVRNREFNATAVIELVDQLTTDPRVQLSLLYVDCASAELIRRYGETRRRHPLALAEAPAEGIAREIDLLAPIRVRAPAPGRAWSSGSMPRIGHHHCQSSARAPPTAADLLAQG